MRKNWHGIVWRGTSRAVIKRGCAPAPLDTAKDAGLLALVLDRLASVELMMNGVYFDL